MDMNKPPHKSSNIALRFSAFAERWFPDSFVFVALAVVLVALAAIVNGAPATAVFKTFGDGFWSLITFTLLTGNPSAPHLDANFAQSMGHPGTLVNGGLVARIPVGINPHGLTVWPQPGRFSLGHTGNTR